jgi:hypothetical protein
LVVILCTGGKRCWNILMLYCKGVPCCDTRTAVLGNFGEFFGILRGASQHTNLEMRLKDTTTGAFLFKIHFASDGCVDLPFLPLKTNHISSNGRLFSIELVERDTGSFAWQLWGSN